MEAYHVKYCDECNKLIVAGQKWCRMKDPYSTMYFHFHLGLLKRGDELSCWEKWELRQEARRLAAERKKEVHHAEN